MPTLEMVIWGSLLVLIAGILILLATIILSGKARCSEQDELYDRLEVEEIERRLAPIRCDDPRADEVRG